MRKNKKYWECGVSTDDNSCDQEILEQTFIEAGINNNRSGFRFFSESYLKNELGIDASFDYLINIKKRNVVLFNGVIYNKKRYYTIDDFGLQNISSDTLSTIEFDVEQGNNTEIILSNVMLKFKKTNNEYSTSDISKFKVHYRKSEDENWLEATKDLIKFVDEKDGKMKYKFSVPEITDTSVLNVYYDVKVSTIENREEIKENTEYNIPVESNNYVKTGLLLHLDGINNTGNGHSMSTNTWKDLSDNNNDVTLSTTGTEGPAWEEDDLLFDGVDDYATGSATTNGNITVEFIGKIENTNNAVIYMINTWMSSVTSPSMQLWCTSSNSSFPRILVPATGEDTYREIGETQFSSATNLKTAQYTITKDNNAVKYKVNGKLIKEYTDSEFLNRFNITNLIFTIGKWHSSNSYYSKQELNGFRIYNRALTDEEIEHNYRIDKYRFNIE